MIMVRFADDFLAGFEHLGDAKQFLADLHRRFGRFGLELHEDKTRLIQFGRFAIERRAERALGKPETFDFLGFTHVCAKTSAGRFFLKRITISTRKRAKLKAVKDQLKQRRHAALPVQGAWLASVVRGHAAYYSVPGNIKAVILPHPGDTVLVPGATAPQPANPPHLETKWTSSPPDGCHPSALCTPTRRHALTPDTQGRSPVR
jgi:hypothetical protein